jgi:hypothetical protein
MPDSILENAQTVTPQKRNRPQLVTTVDPTTKAFFEWVRRQWGLDNNGHAQDYIVTAILSGRQFDTSGFTDDAGQTDPILAAFLVLFAGFIGFGIFAAYCALMFGGALNRLLAFGF